MDVTLVGLDTLVSEAVREALATRSPEPAGWLDVKGAAGDITRDVQHAKCLLGTARGSRIEPASLLAVGPRRASSPAQ